LGALKDSKVPVELLYAPYDHPDFIERLRCVIRAARAYSRIERSRIGVIGGLFPNLVSCRYDPQIVNSRLGATLIPIPFEEIRNRIQSIATNMNDLEQLQGKITGSYKIESTDLNALNAGVQLHLALKQIAVEQNIDGFATECWSGFPRELGLNPCLGFVEDAYTLACEGDVILCISLLLVRYLIDTSAYVGDLYDLDMNGIIMLVHCGAPASLSSNKEEIVVSKSQLALERDFETITCRPRLENGPVTLFRFYGQECDKLHLASGELLSSELSPNLMVKIQLNGNRWDFLDQCFGNHYVVVKGDIRSELKLLGKWLGITIFET
jgi:L-fucose isomerase-like protein